MNKKWLSLSLDSAMLAAAIVQRFSAGSCLKINVGVREFFGLPLHISRADIAGDQPPATAEGTKRAFTSPLMQRSLTSCSSRGV